ncbi:alpha/beta fold hydrolase [Paenibacillus abyssi]|uniref:Alpha/beta hydrolase n=1 Tax=Paenibacillus abyssi TaxID=1340531 RepID=A0A917CR20_9BACL|nr:alpha/beta hydrolase [Paenibacillus abyssi]GGF95709.1 alpha/beta hydrolase [Paenibacillus abyssi]
MMKPTTLANEKMVISSGGELAFYDSGVKENTGGTVILLHGYCGSSAYWEKVLPYLQAAGRIIALDMRGHGASFAPEDEIYAIEDFADDVKLLMDHLKIERACIIGHSLGGYVALAAAERFPQRLNGFALVHSTAHSDSEAAKENRDKAAQTIRGEGIRVFVDGLVPKLFAPDHVEKMALEVARIKEIGYATSVHAAAATALGMKERQDRNAVLRETELPVLLLAGEEDKVIPPERTFSATEEHISTVVLEHAGHMGMVEAAPELASALDRFIRSL